MGGALAGEAASGLFLSEPAFATASRPRVLIPEAAAQGVLGPRALRANRTGQISALVVLGVAGLARPGQAKRRSGQQVVRLAVTEADATDKLSVREKAPKALEKGKKGGKAISKKQNKERKLISTQKRLQRLFEEEFKSSLFSENPLYESPESIQEGRQKLYKYWLENRPLREIERCCDGKTTVGCTWKQSDGKRGVTYCEFTEEGRFTYIREVIQPDAPFRLNQNSWKSMQPIYAVSDFTKSFLNFNPAWVTTEDPDSETQLPLMKSEEPMTGRASDVVRFLWEEAWLTKFEGTMPALKMLAPHFSEDCVYEDLTISDEHFAVGREAVLQYLEETLNSAHPTLKWILDDVTDGDRACVALWHCEFGIQTKPRGVTYYELNEEGKVCYARAAYNFSW
mmetsp:Transcript_10380/g.18498  ORF Transcript_10380/g.18498 Transcript_10380/m.18498 type:complete len:397 (+) Transcript_10380:29-1219(+)